MKILLVDDHTILRAGIRQILQDEGGRFETGEAKNAAEAIKKLHAEKWDMVLLDISLPDKNGIELLKQIKAHWPQLPALILSMYSEDQFALRALRAGAAGYLTKESAPELLVQTIDKVINGKRYISSDLAERLVLELNSGIEKPLHDTLSDREFEILRLIASGLSVTDISVELTLSVKTISTYRSRLLKKMHLKNNAELIHYAIKHQLVE